MRKILFSFSRSRRLYNTELTLNSFKEKLERVAHDEGASNALTVLKNNSTFSTHVEIMEKEADLNLTLNNIDHSLDIYSQILEQKETLSNETLCVLNVKIAECHIRLGDKQSAIDHLQKAILYNPENTMPLHVLADHYFQIGKDAKIEYDQRINFEKAIKILDDVIKINFEDISAYMTQGNIFKFWKRYDDAESKFTELLKVDPENLEVLFHLGDVGFYTGKFNLANSYFTKFLENFVTFVENMQKSGQKFDVEGFYGEVLFKRCQCILANEEWQLAIKQYTHLIEYLKEIKSNSLALAFNKRGYAYYRVHNWQQCVDDNTMALEADPKCIEAYRDRMEAYEVMGLQTEAKEDKRNYEFLLRKKLTIKNK